MRRKYKILIVIILIVVILGINVSNSIAVTNNYFFYINKKEIAQGEKLKMTLDISKIKYDEFQFRLTSNLDTNSIVIEDDVEIENYNNDININVDKSKMNLDKIVFYYKVPENAIVGSKIELIAQIIVGVEKEGVIDDKETNNAISEEESEVTNSNNEEISDTELIDNNNEIENNITKTEIQYEVVESRKIEVTVIENKTDEKENEKKSEPKEENNKNNKENKDDIEKNIEKEKNDIKDSNNIDKPQDKEISNEFDKQNIDMQSFSSEKENTNSFTKKPSIQTQTTNYTSNSINFSNNSLSQTVIETAVYNGSSNNYLSNIEIEGEDLNTTFNKENTTYFLKTTGKTELNINATTEEDNAKVYITGNTNLKRGENKILISVTAENGDVRYYRIFVTNN